MLKVVDRIFFKLNFHRPKPRSSKNVRKMFFPLFFYIVFFFRTTLNRQGNDAGTQYASVIFCSDMKQQEIANKVMAELQKAIDQKKVTTYNENTVQTGIVPYTKYYPAHEEHQQYLEKNPSGYCNHRYRFKEWPTDLN